MPIIKPLVREAKLRESCWLAVTKLINVPRCEGYGADVTMVMAGIKRPDISTMNNVWQQMALNNVAVVMLVMIIMGTDEAIANQVNIFFFP